MSVFRRRGRSSEEPGAAAGQEVPAPDDEPGAADPALAVDVPDEPEVDAPAGLSPRPDGPWDVSERPEPEGYVDLGAVRLKGRDGMELRLEVEEATGNVTAATVQLGGSAVQLQAFAAPRSEGIWDEIRTEIADGVTRQGGTADEVPGPFGRELIARIPVRSSDGRTGHQPARFSGIDGPRWFLRAVFHGAAVHEPEAAALLESVVRDVVVVRGSEAMAPRDLLPLRLPEAAQDGEPQDGGPRDAGGEPEEETRPPLEPFRRGPEITEVR